VKKVELAIERNTPETVTMKRTNPGLKKIKELLEGYGHTSEELLVAVAAIVDREITSSNDLADDEIQFVLEYLEVASS